MSDDLVTDLLADAAKLRRRADQMHPDWHQATAAALRAEADRIEELARKMALK